MPANSPFMHPGTGEFIVSVIAVLTAAFGVCAYWALWWYVIRVVRVDAAAAQAAAEPARRAVQEARLVEEEVRRAAQFAAHMEIYLERAVRDMRAVHVAFVASTEDDRVSASPSAPDELGSAKTARMYPALAYPV